MGGQYHDWCVSFLDIYFPLSQPEREVTLWNTVSERKEGFGDIRSTNLKLGYWIINSSFFLKNYVMGIMVHLTCLSLAHTWSLNYTRKCEVRGEFGVRYKDYGEGEKCYSIIYSEAKHGFKDGFVFADIMEHFSLNKPWNSVHITIVCMLADFLTMIILYF